MLPDLLNQPARPKPYCLLQLGVLILLAAMIGGIGLPAFIIHPVSIWSYIAARRAARNPGSSGGADAALAPTVVTSNASSLVGTSGHGQHHTCSCAGVVGPWSVCHAIFCRCTAESLCC
jgi:hypothetical protein